MKGVKVKLRFLRWTREKGKGTPLAIPLESLAGLPVICRRTPKGYSFYISEPLQETT